MRIIELFGGIGACTQALKRLGIEVEVVDYVEIDKYAVASYNAINETNFETQDITKYNKHFDNIDLIIHGSPCQDFSVAGKQAGGDEGSGTRSSLMYETIRIVKDIKPKYVIWENVKNLLSKNHKHNFDNYINMMNEIGYNSYYKILNAKNYGIPQNRERVFTISIRKDIKKDFRFPDPVELKLRLKDMLEDDVDESFYLSDKQIEGISHWKSFRNPIKEAQTGNDICNCVTAKCNTSLNASMLLIKNNTKKGYLEAEEGDGVYTVIGNKRGTVQKNTIQTITTRQDVGVVVRNKKEQLCDYLIYNNIVKENDVIDHSFSNNRIDQIKKEKNIIKANNENPTLTTRPNTLGYVEKKYNNFIEKNGHIPEIFNPYNEKELKDIAPTQSTQCGSTTSSATVLLNKELRIRKLTPKECWRLMGFSDEAFEKAEKVNSNAQLYKQAGNSIVVDVLEKILKNLLGD